MNSGVIQAKKHSIRDLEKSPLTSGDLERIVKLGTIIRLTWGGEYIDFRYYEPSYMECNSMNFLELVNLKATTSGGFYPVEGSSVFLDYEDSPLKIDIKPYSMEEFLQLSKKATTLTVIDFKYNPDEPNILNLFDDVKFTFYTDYSQMVSDLEEKEVVVTCPSENILRTDERKFSLTEKSKEILPKIYLDEYINKFHEVDSLGTSFFIGLTNIIKILHSELFKDKN